MMELLGTNLFDRTCVVRGDMMLPQFGNSS